MNGVCMKHGRLICSECNKVQKKGSEKMDIFKLQSEVWKIAEDRGWHEGEELLFGEFIALCHAELSEALEIYRSKGATCITHVKHVRTNQCNTVKPDGIPIELADVIIRILDYCETNGIDMVKAINQKCHYNKKRDYRHGGKVI